MSNQIYDTPTPNGAGLEFDYAAYEANTEVTLVNIKLDNSYKDILSPAALTRLDAYIDSQVDKVVYPNMVPIRMGEPISIPLPYNVASNYNYLRAVHKARPVQDGPADVDRTYYYFITGYIEDSTNSTQIILQQDLWATRGRDARITSAFVQRGHIGIAADNATEDYYDRFLTVPEGLDIGTDYRPIISFNAGAFNLANTYALVLSNTRLEPPYFSSGKPIKRTADGGTFSGMPSGASFYVFSRSDLKLFMDDVSLAPHIAQGIMSITLVPDFERFFPSFSYSPYPAINRAPQAIPIKPYATVIPNFRDSIMLNQYPRYRGLKKFATSPYCMVELANNAGSSSHIKPEMIGSDDIVVAEQVNFVPPGQRYVAWIRNVLSTGFNAAISALEMTRALAYSVVNSGFPTLPMVNDAGTLYLTQNARSLQYGVESAEWTREKAARSTQVSYDQQSKSIGASGEALGIAQRGEQTQRQLAEGYSWGQAALGAVGNVAQGAMGGAVAGPAGAAAGAGMAAASVPMGLLGNGLAQQQANISLRASQGTQNAQQALTTRTAEYMRDTNADLARFAANGDYENVIAGIQAKTQDAKLAPNSMVGSFGGESFNLVNGVPVFTVNLKSIRDGVARRIGEYWLRYGYAIERYIDIPSSLMVMSRFTYWKMTDVYLDAAPMPESNKDALRGIFEKGVTVWDDPDLIGIFGSRDPAIAPVNQPLSGITL